VRVFLLLSVLAVVAMLLVAACGSDSPSASGPSPAPSPTPGVTVIGLSLNPAIVTGGQGVEANVEISAPAPASGTTVILTSSDAAAPVPASALITQGLTVARFTVQTRTVTSDVSATLTATVGGSSRTAVLKVSAIPLPRPDSLVFNPAIVEGGQTTTGTVRLDRLPLTGPAVVTLSSDDASLAVPASIQISVGAGTGTFTASTKQVSAQVVPRVTAASGGQSIATPVTVLPRALPTISTSFSYTSSAGDYLGGGRSATWTSSNAEFLATAHCDGSYLDARVQTRPRNDIWNITVVAPQGARLTSGMSLSNVQNQIPSLPRFFISGESRACNKTYSSFQIHEATFLAGSVSRFRMSFETRCEDPNAPAFRGDLSLNDVPMYAYEVRNSCN